jgi:hypothetical protein
MRTLAAALVARPVLAAIRIAGIAGVGILLAAQTVPYSTRPVLTPDQIAPARPKHTFSWVPALKGRIAKCWSPARGAPPAPMRIYFELRRDGTLAGPPRHMSRGWDGAPPAQVQRAIQAIEKCQPYAFLPQSEYAEGWDKLDVTFDFGKPAGEPGKAGSDAGAAPGDAGKPSGQPSIVQDERKR